MVTDEEIEVECNKITKDGTVLCDITTQNLAKMNRLGIKPENNQFNVKDKISSPKSTQETTESVEAKPKPETKEEPATEENKSTEGTQATEENKSIDETKPTEADSSNNQGCGCSITENEIAKFVAKYLQKNEEN